MDEHSSISVAAQRGVSPLGSALSFGVSLGSRAEPRGSLLPGLCDEPSGLGASRDQGVARLPDVSGKRGGIDRIRSLPAWSIPRNRVQVGLQAKCHDGLPSSLRDDQWVWLQGCARHGRLFGWIRLACRGVSTEPPKCNWSLAKVTSVNRNQVPIGFARGGACGWTNDVA